MFEGKKDVLADYDSGGGDSGKVRQPPNIMTKVPRFMRACGGGHATM